MNMPKNLREVQSSILKNLSSNGIRPDIAKYIRSGNKKQNEAQYYYGASANALELWGKTLQGKNKNSKVIELFDEEF